MSTKSSKLSYHGSPHHHHEIEHQLITQTADDDDDDDNDDEHQHHHHHHEEEEEEEQLIPGLPDHIAHLILCKIPASVVYSVCHLWRSFIYTPLFPPYYSLYALLTPIHSISTSQQQQQHQQQFVTNVCLFNFDPISAQWQPLPSPPNLSLLLRHPPFISRELSVQSVTVGDKIAVVAGTTLHLTPALTRPVLFDPFARGWMYGPPFPVPRRWCASGALNASLYIISGVGPQFSTDTARSVEKWDPTKGLKWEKRCPLKDGRFSREAADAIGWRGRLCMVNVKGDAAKQGGVYQSESDTWEEMKEGMVGGWRGPAVSMDEEEVYVVDESKGVVRKYVEERDLWVDVVESHRLRGAKQMAARGGKLCVVCGGGAEIVVVDVVANQSPMWVVDPPQGFIVAALHILPRMSGPPTTFNHTKL